MVGERRPPRSGPTSKRPLAEALRELADNAPRSETERLREIFDDVEAALAAGATREAVHATLQQNGFTFTFTSFKSALQRIRKERKQGE
jgi:hypothetical protein